MSQTKTKYIQPLYLNILEKTIGSTLAAFCQNNPLQSWDALLTLYDVLDGEIKEQVKPTIEETKLEINKLANMTIYSPIDIVDRQSKLDRYINVNKHKILQKIMTLLQEKGYLKFNQYRITKETFRNIDEKEATEDAEAEVD